MPSRKTKPGAAARRSTIAGRGARLLALLLTLLAVPVLVPASASALNSPTVVTFGFDDGLASQYAQRSVLSDHRVNATFYVNSNLIGRSGHLTWTDLRALADAGNEVGGHTLDHRSLPALSTPDQTRQVCDDRTALVGRGYVVRNFAYPNGATSSGVKTVVAGCGYETARLTGGLDYGDPCCVFAEPLPPRDAFGVRALQPGDSTTVSDFTGAIDTAQSRGGGWLNFVMHDLCRAPCSGEDDYAVSVETLDAVLDWIETQPAVTVRTASDAIGPPPDRTAPTVTLTAPADAATVSGTVTLSANASDAVGVDHVDFLVGGSVVATDSSSPYSYAWDSTARAGTSVAITARAYDRASNSATSAAATVTVRAVPPPPAPTTFVTLGFDDGLASQYAFRSILSDHRAHATLFVNTNRLGRTGYLTWTELRALADAGHEVGGHTLDHRSLPPLSTPDQTRQVCDDRTALATAGYTAAAFAYPSGQFNSAVKSVVAGCGYTTARTTGGLDYPDPCCVMSEWTPPKDRYAVRAFEPRLSTGLAVYQDLITKAHDSGGGWVDLVLHGVCADPCRGADEYDISDTTLDGLLDWIDTQPEVAVKSTAEVLALGDRTLPYTELSAPVRGATISGTVTLRADAIDNVALDRVEFLVGGVVVGSDRSSPYSYAWSSTGTASPATIAARAVDTSGNAYTSAAATVTIR